MSSTQVFQQMANIMGNPKIDLFASRLYHQLTPYPSLKPDPNSVTTDAFKQPWHQPLCYALSPFNLITGVLRKVAQEKVPEIILITPSWHTQPWYTQLLQLLIQETLLLPRWENLLTNSQGKNHPLLVSKTLSLAVWKVSGETYRREIFHRKLQNLCYSQEKQTPYLITNRLGVSGLAGGIKNMSPIRASVADVVNFLTEIMIYSPPSGREYRTLNCTGLLFQLMM